MIRNDYSFGAGLSRTEGGIGNQANKIWKKSRVRAITCCNLNMSNKKVLLRWSELSLLLAERGSLEPFQENRYKM